MSSGHRANPTIGDYFEPKKSKFTKKGKAKTGERFEYEGELARSIKEFQYSMQAPVFFLSVGCMLPLYANGLIRFPQASIAFCAINITTLLSSFLFITWYKNNVAVKGDGSTYKVGECGIPTASMISVCLSAAYYCTNLFIPWQMSSKTLMIIGASIGGVMGLLLDSFKPPYSNMASLPLPLNVPCTAIVGAGAMLFAENATFTTIHLLNIGPIPQEVALLGCYAFCVFSIVTSKIALNISYNAIAETKLDGPVSLRLNPL